MYVYIDVYLKLLYWYAVMSSSTYKCVLADDDVAYFFIMLPSKTLGILLCVHVYRSVDVLDSHSFCNL